MESFWYLTWGPLASAAVWLALAGYLIYLERYRTWTEIFLIALSLSIAAYGVADSIFFTTTATTSNEQVWRIAAAASLSAVTFSAFFTFLYGISLYRRFRRILAVVLIPVAFFVITFYEEMFSTFSSLGSASDPSVPVYNPAWLEPWTVLMIILIAGGMYGIIGAYLAIRRQSPKLARRVGLTLLGLVIAAVAGSVTNTFLAFSPSNPAPPLFSTTLILPGFLLFYAAAPSVFSRLNAAILRDRAAQYDVKGAILTFQDGTVIGSRLAREDDMIDADSFSAALDVIQNFMHTSFPLLRGKWLKSIRHGDYTLVMERGQYTFLTLVIGGQENDQLRRLAIESLTGFETTNLEALQHWRGISTDAEGVDTLLDGMLAGR